MSINVMEMFRTMSPDRVLNLKVKACHHRYKVRKKTVYNCSFIFLWLEDNGTVKDAIINELLFISYPRHHRQTI